MKKPVKDKIFNNTFDTTEVSSTPISFNKDSLMSDETVDQQVDRAMVEERIEQAVGRCDWAVEMLGRENAAKTVTKAEANSLFKFLFDEVGGHSVEVFAYMEREMDLDPSRLYDNLSNSIKTELHEELRRRGYLKGQRNVMP